VSDFSYNFSAQVTANPWTGPATLLKLFSYPDWQIVNGTGLQSTTAYNSIWFAHNVDYVGSATAIVAEITIPSTTISSDHPAAGIFVRTGANAGAGYNLELTTSTTANLQSIATNGARTYLAGITLGTITTSSLIGLSYVPSTGVLTATVDGVSKGTFVDTTWAAEASLAAGGYLYQTSGAQTQAISTFAGTGVAAATSLTSISGDDILVDGETLSSYVGTGLSAANDIRVTNNGDSVTATWSISGQTATGGIISAATRGNLPYTDTNHVLTAYVRDVTPSNLASRTITLQVPSGYVTYQLDEASAIKTLGDSGLYGIGTIPVKSQVKLPVSYSGNTINYELISGIWTGRISFASFIIPTSITLNGEYRPGDTGVWQNLTMVLYSPIVVSGIADSSIVGNPTIKFTKIISVSGVATSAAVGTPTIVQNTFKVGAPTLYSKTRTHLIYSTRRQ